MGYKTVSPCAHQMVTASPSMILLSGTKSCLTIVREQPVFNTISSTWIPSTGPLQHTEDGLNHD